MKKRDKDIALDILGVAPAQIPVGLVERKLPRKKGRKVKKPKTSVDLWKFC